MPSTMALGALAASNSWRCIRAVRSLDVIGPLLTLTISRAREIFLTFAFGGQTFVAFVTRITRLAPRETSRGTIPGGSATDLPGGDRGFHPAPETMRNHGSSECLRAQYW